MKDNPYLFNEENLNDFGFTFSSEEDITSNVISSITTQNESEIKDLKNRLEAIRKIYLPFLENLAKNPEQPIIKWPERGPVLKKEINRLTQLTEVKR